MSDYEFRIRYGREADIDICAAINAENFHFILEDRRQRILKRAVTWQGVLVAEIKGQIAGYAIFDPDWFDSTFLKLVVADAKYRRRGIAFELIQQIEREHCPSGRFFSSTEDENLASRELHKKLGFVESGYLANLPQPHNEVFFFKPAVR